MATQEAQTVHGSWRLLVFFFVVEVRGSKEASIAGRFFSQLSTFARMRAADVLPVPFGPASKYACAYSPELKSVWNCSRTGVMSRSATS